MSGFTGSILFTFFSGLTAFLGAIAFLLMAFLLNALRAAPGGVPTGRSECSYYWFLVMAWPGPLDRGLVASSFFALRSGLVDFLAAMVDLLFEFELAAMGGHWT